MNIHVQLVEGPLVRSTAPDVCPPETRTGVVGAWLCFEGIVRALEDGRPLQGLDYQVYEPMATRQLTELAQAIRDSHNLLHIRARHSRGFVPVGECSFRLEVLAEHRKPALRAMDEFIDRMKQDVPIWKLPVWKT